MAWAQRHELAIESDDALCRLRDAMHKHPADAHETYFTANGENYRIRIERIPQPMNLYEASLQAEMIPLTEHAEEQVKRMLKIPSPALPQRLMGTEEGQLRAGEG